MQLGNVTEYNADGVLDKMVRKVLHRDLTLR